MKLNKIGTKASVSEPTAQDALKPQKSFVEKSSHFHEKKKKRNFNSKKFSGHSDMKEVLADSRFSHISVDPRYRNAPAVQRKVQLDKRFESVFTDDLFYEKSCMDPRGRPKNFSTRENLKKFYNMQLSDESESDEGESDKVEDEDDDGYDEEDDDDGEDDSVSDETDEIDSNTVKNKLINKDKLASVSEITDSEQNIKKVQKEKTKYNLASQKEKPSNKIITESKENSNKIPEELLERLKDMECDIARGDAFFSDDSSDDDSTTTDEEDGDEFGEFEWGELDHDAQWDCETEVEETSRFAVCNMDWDRIKAVDLMVLFSSFSPVGGFVKKIALYPSEFGKERLIEEEAMGPQELVRLVASKKKENDSDLMTLEKIKKGTLDESDRASCRQIEALRRYQRNRLKYYYAVVDCDSLETAKVIYKECDRTPYELAGVILDLRYIPLEMNFDDEIPQDVCETLPDSYENQEFQTTALLDAKPTLTWDETDRTRKRTLTAAMAKAIKKQNFDEEKLLKYVANSSEESEEEGNEDTDSDEELKTNRITKFRALIEEMENKRNKNEMHIDKEETFELHEDKEQDNTDEESAKEEEEKYTPFEKYLVKKKEKRIASKKAKMDKCKEAENENGIGEKDYDKHIQISDDELPEDAKHIMKDRFFASQTKLSKNKRKKSKTLKEQLPVNEDDENLELMLMDEEVEDKKHFNMREILEDKRKLDKKKKGKKLQDVNKTQNTQAESFKVDLADSRFSALTKSGDFNIDPAHPQYNQTNAMDSLTKDVLKKRKSDIPEEEKVTNKRSRLGFDVSNLVEYLKLKTKN